MGDKKESFEEAFEKLKDVSEKIKDENTSLEDSIKLFEEGMEYYKSCNDILVNAEQKIELMETGKDE